MADEPALTLLYDGGCPLCLREVDTLRARDRGRGRIRFVDIDAPDYDPSAHGGISYREAMGRMRGLCADGRVIKDVAVFRRPTGWWDWVGCMPPPPGP